MNVRILMRYSSGLKFIRLGKKMGSRIDSYHVAVKFSPTHQLTSSSARQQLMMDDEKDSILVRHSALRIYSRVTYVVNSEERALCTPYHGNTYHWTTPLQDQASAKFYSSTGRSGI